MTRDDAISITSMVLNGWAKPDWTDGQTEAYVNALIPYDADHMTNAVALAHRELQFRPPFSELYGYYKAAKADDAARRGPKVYTPEKGNKLPFWVKRWVCARFLYAKFGKEKDMRTFPEQRQWSGPEGLLMPPNEWVDEANRITDLDAMRAVAP